MCNRTANPSVAAQCANPSGRAQPSRQRTWGFRFSWTDTFTLVVFGAAAVGLYHLSANLCCLLIIPVAHFFLFCNVFRMLRRREIIWAVLFVINVALWVLAGHFEWQNVLFCQIPVSLGTIYFEIRSSRYHGIFADRVNPRLKDCLEGTERFSSADTRGDR